MELDIDVKLIDKGAEQLVTHRIIPLDFPVALLLQRVSDVELLGELSRRAQERHPEGVPF